MAKPFWQNERFLRSAASIAVMLIIALVYFKPILEGKRVQAGDMIQIKGMQQDVHEFRENYNEEPYWSESMFSGMPAYTIHAHYEGNVFSWLHGNVVTLIDYPVLAFFFCMVSAFFLLRLWRLSIWLAMAGAIGYAFFSYHVIIVEAGHYNKVMALMFVPPVLLAIFYTFQRRNLLWGFILMALAMGMQINYKHPQMAFYLLLVVACYGIYELIQAIRNQELGFFFRAVGVLALATALGLGASAAKILPMYEYSKLSNRGPNELDVPVEEIAAGDTQPGSQRGQQEGGKNKVKESGLSKDYAFNWSKGRAEMFTLLIPNFMGGGSDPWGMFDRRTGGQPEHMTPQQVRKLQQNRRALQKVQQSRQFRSLMTTYWGPQPFTSGPEYLGAIVWLLFVLGLMLVRGGMKYALLYAVLLGGMLAMGKNSPAVYEALAILALPALYIFTYHRIKIPAPAYGIGLAFIGFLILALGADPGQSYRLSDLFFDYVPFYNRFRAPSSMLVIFAMAVPWLAFLGAYHLLNPKHDQQYRLRSLYYATGLVGGVCLIFALMPGAFLDFLKPQTQAYLNQQGMGLNPAMQQIIQVFQDARKGMLQADAGRSLFFILAVAVGLWLYTKNYIKHAPTIAIVTLVLVAMDLLVVDWRYLSWGDYVRESKFQQNFQMPATERFILNKLEKNRDDYYRVYPSNRNPFNDAKTAYYLNSIGGYNAAKIKRYQQLADVHILNPGNKYRFYGDKFPKQARGSVTPYDLNPKVANMLNMRYLIARPQYSQMARLPQYELMTKQTRRGETVLRNQNNYGPAWIVNNVKKVKEPSDALRSLYNIDTRRTAVIEQKDWDELDHYSQDSLGPNEYVRLKHHQNNRLVYEFQSDKPRFVVFSEVYYKHGWNAYIDCDPREEADCEKRHIFHTNFVLRGLEVPAGQHTIYFEFDPQSVKQGATISYASSSIILLALLGAIGWTLYSRYRRGLPLLQGGQEATND